MERKRIYLVGLGPGGREQMTQQAYAALADADVLCGYTGYVDLVSCLLYTSDAADEL